MASTMNKVFIPLVFLFVIYSECSASSYYTKAVVESCRGCSLNRLPDIKKFIFEDLPEYDRVEFKPMHGAKPELVLYTENDEIAERLQLSSMTREECNELLVSKGFVRDTKPVRDEI